MSLKSSISSHVRILYRFDQFVTTRYTTDFYKEDITRWRGDMNFIFEWQNNILPGAIIGDGDRKRALFLVLGLAP